MWAAIKLRANKKELRDISQRRRRRQTLPLHSSCRCSKIMSPLNCNETLSPHLSERQIQHLKHRYQPDSTVLKAIRASPECSRLDRLSSGKYYGVNLLDGVASTG